MACKEFLMCLFLLNEIILTNFQVIHDQQNRCNSNVDKDLLLKVRELQLELIAYRDQAIKTERRLQDQLSQFKEEFAKYRNESIDKQKALGDEGNQFIGNLIIMVAYLIQVENREEYTVEHKYAQII